MAVTQANSSLEDQSQVFVSPSTTYVGVYDGHGGPEASRFVAKRLLPYLHILGKTNSKAERLSVDHNVSDEEIRKEVEALHPHDSHVVLRTRGVWRIKGIIQVSRSIGDVYLKRPDFYRDPVFQQFGNPIPLTRPVMTAEPSITVRELQPEDLFLIFASDGLWEQLTDQEAVDIVFKYPRAGIAKRLVRAALQVAAKKKEIRYDDLKKIDKGIRRNFHDDITVVVIYLDHHKHSKHRSTTAPIDIYSPDDEEAEQCMLAAVA
ncbi:hypothetical protein SESBI_44986 [Sesbania bispinosa]|nr:hypothetical protein SESBI_44986 [Sesbania bispinosa]